MKTYIFRDDPDSDACLRYRKAYLAKYGENCALTNDVLVRIITKSKRRGRVLAHMKQWNEETP